ncbi:SubName: Full=Uncharacterized protein {ECO:0000313/EMBL:CCA70250.1} [Serendipita indica DSM 11827]|uniref:Uncharacterized protein n=1 Tax=Serendipita indica (strain DSM 11827) TaxID=1109443 RepID=G4TG01_SERID|nr:SubName: Full=Uncharacterized protein {ECO:0000313/EMBL:CCA70250.1} [Serendipita indica DSM 11827]CCA70250.1 hypothetical protein PIIN_04189 [Serendipita indica DSM 11827]
MPITAESWQRATQNWTADEISRGRRLLDSNGHVVPAAVAMQEEDENIISCIRYENAYYITSADLFVCYRFQTGINVTDRKMRANIRRGWDTRPAINYGFLVVGPATHSELHVRLQTWFTRRDSYKLFAWESCGAALEVITEKLADRGHINISATSETRNLLTESLIRAPQPSLMTHPPNDPQGAYFSMPAISDASQQVVQL